MPLGPKLLVALQAFFGLWTVTVVVGGFMHHASGSMQTARLVILAFQLALLAGLLTRQRIAWYVARWLFGFLIVVYVPTLIGTIIYFFVTASAIGAYAWRSEEFYMTGLISVILIIATIFFRLLGRADSRAYLNGPHRPNQAMQPTSGQRTASPSYD